MMMTMACIMGIYGDHGAPPNEYYGNLCNDRYHHYPNSARAHQNRSNHLVLYKYNASGFPRHEHLQNARVQAYGYSEAQRN